VYSTVNRVLFQIADHNRESEFPKIRSVDDAVHAYARAYTAHRICSIHICMTDVGKVYHLTSQTHYRYFTPIRCRCDHYAVILPFSIQWFLRSCIARFRRFYGNGCGGFFRFLCSYVLSYWRNKMNEWMNEYICQSY